MAVNATPGTYSEALSKVAAARQSATPSRAMARGRHMVR